MDVLYVRRRTQTPWDPRSKTAEQNHMWPQLYDCVSKIHAVVRRHTHNYGHSRTHPESGWCSPKNCAHFTGQFKWTSFQTEFATRGVSKKEAVVDMNEHAYVCQCMVQATTLVSQVAWKVTTDVHVCMYRRNEAWYFHCVDLWCPKYICEGTKIYDPWSQIVVRANLALTGMDETYVKTQ